MGRGYRRYIDLLNFEVLKHVKGTVLDIAAGVGNEACIFAHEMERPVVSIDNSCFALTILNGMPSIVARNESFTSLTEGDVIESLAPCALINIGYALYYATPKECSHILQKSLFALNAGGVLCGNHLDKAYEGVRSSCTREGLIRFFEAYQSYFSLDIYVYETTEKGWDDALGHPLVFNTFIVRKR